MLSVYETCLNQAGRCYAQVEDWIDKNPTTIKAIATAGIILGGVLLVAASTPFLGADVVIAFVIVGGVLSLVSAVVDVYAEHHFQKMIQEPAPCRLHRRCRKH